MKNFMLIVAFLATTVAGAQTIAECQKIGFADTQYIVQHMPEIRQMQAELASLGSQLEKQFNAKVEDFESKVKNYREVSVGLSDVARNEQENELYRMETAIRKFQEEAEASYRKKQEELMKPIHLKVGRTIEEIAKEHAYNVIVNTELPAGQRVLLYLDNQYDITDLVLKKMGISVNQNKREY